jgi:hypothetical protein
MDQILTSFSVGMIIDSRLGGRILGFGFAIVLGLFMLVGLVAGLALSV